MFFVHTYIHTHIIYMYIVHSHAYVHMLYDNDDGNVKEDHNFKQNYNAHTRFLLLF